MMGFGLLFTLFIVGLVAYLLGWRPQSMNLGEPRENPTAPLDILKARYARGEISQDEYQQMRQDLER